MNVENKSDYYNNFCGLTRTGTLISGMPTYRQNSKKNKIAISISKEKVKTLARK
jgi:hypothetical protein